MFEFAGEYVVQHYFQPILFVFPLYGVYLVTAGLAIYILLRRSENKAAKIILVSIIGIHLGSSTAQVFFDYLEVALVMVYKGSQSNIGKSPYSAFNQEYFVVRNVLPSVNVVLGDSILVWRLWILCRDKLVLHIINALFIVTSFACLVASTTISEGAANPYLVAGYKGLRLSANAMLLTTNIIVTSTLIWKHRRVRLFKVKTSSPASKVLVLLIEYGLLYALFQIFSFVVEIGLSIAALREPDFHGSSSGQINLVWDNLLNITLPLVGMLAAILPTLAVAIPALRESVHESRAAVLSSLHFEARHGSTSQRSATTPTDSELGSENV